MTLEDYFSSVTPQYFTSIARSDVQAANIIYPYSVIQLIQGNLFYGLPSEDSHAHLVTYIEICNTMKIVRVPEDAICLNLLSFSLASEAKRWLHLFKGNSLRIWEEMVEKFWKKYFPESKTVEEKVEISSFHQLKYRQSPCGIDIWTFILTLLLVTKIGTLANELTSFWRRCWGLCPSYLVIHVSQSESKK